MQQHESVEERRRYFRLNKVMPAHFTVLREGPGSDDEPPGEASADAPRERIFVVDISAGGFRATAHRRLPVQSLLKTEVYIEKTRPVTARCRVVWERELSIPDMYEVGFEFTDIEQTEWKRLVDYIVEERARATRSQPVTWTIEKGYLNRPLGGE